ncbi:hypothetical protein FACS189425_06110 [Clostridia bacterium]|nr:hypothetical protein FACS189425_06110 [Clostridia bacterium]
MEIKKYKDALILPPVVPEDSPIWAEIIASFQDGVIFGGNMPAWFQLKIAELGGATANYLADPSFAETNAIPTAEAAIAIAISSTSFTLNGANIAILGNGRVGKALSARLAPFGANIAINDAENAAIIFNTIDSAPETLRASIPDTAFVIDIATNSGLTGDNIHRFPSLPSKYSPQTAAEIAQNTIDYMLESEVRNEI